MRIENKVMTSGSLKVNLSAIRNNWIELNRLSSSYVKTSAVLKAIYRYIQMSVSG